MKEHTLAEFLAGRVAAAELKSDLADAFVPRDDGIIEVHIDDMDDSFVVTREGLLRVCDAVLAGELEPLALEAIGNCLMMSDTFEFDEVDCDVIAELAHWWGSPEICVPLTVANARVFRGCLASRKDPWDVNFPDGSA